MRRGLVLERDHHSRPAAGGVAVGEVPCVAADRGLRRVLKTTDEDRRPVSASLAEREACSSG